MARTSPWLWTPAVLLALAATPAARAADPAKDAVSLQALPGGVADAAGALGFVSNDNRNVVAVNLANGKETFAGARGDYPVAVVGDKVLVLNVDPEKPNVLRMTSMDVLVGKAGVRSDPVTFPDWVDVRPGGDQSFGLVPRIDQGDLWLKWRARAGKPGAKGAKEAAGAVHIDLKSGKVEMLGADKTPPPPPPALRLSKALTKLAERPYETTAGPETNVLTAGAFAAAVDVEKQKVVLRRWDAATEKEQDPVTLAEGGPFQVILSPAAGMVSIRPVPDPKRPADAGRWRVFSLETGKLRASFPAEPGTIGAAVVGGRFFYSYRGPPPPDLQAAAKDARAVSMMKVVDLDTGRLAWWKPMDPDNPFWEEIYSAPSPVCPDP
jgi:hypothetical protein